MSIVVCPLSFVETVCETRWGRMVDAMDTSGRGEALERRPFEIAAAW